MKILFFLVLAFFILENTSHAFQCHKVFRQYRDLEKTKSFKFLTLNMEHFGVEKSKSGRAPEEYKDPEKVKVLIDRIMKANADVISLVELLNEESLAYIVRATQGRYDYYTTKGNDRNRIGFLVKADIPLDVEIISHKELKRTNPFTNKTELVFTRDLPFLIFSRPNLKFQPLTAEEKISNAVMIFGAVHLRSKFLNPNLDVELARQMSDDKRKAEIEAIFNIVQNLKKKYGDNIPLFLSGDFNTEFYNPKTAVPNRELKLLTGIFSNPFDVLNIEPEKHITLASTNSLTGELVKGGLDNILTSIGLESSIQGIYILPYNSNQNILPLPQFISQIHELGQYPSDHHPVLLVISTDKILNK